MNSDEILRISNPYNLSASQFTMIISTAGSVEKWRRIKDGKGIDKGSENCDLCKYYMGGSPYICELCPIFNKTWKSSCINTPYGAWSRHQCSCKISKWGEIGECKECERLANNEFDFLENLLTEIIDTINKKEKNDV